MAARQFAGLGYRAQGEVTADPCRRVDILFMEKDGYVVELVSPNSPDSVVSGLLKTYKNAPYHICYACEDFEAELERLTASGYFQIDEPAPAPAIGGRRVVFLQNAALGMIELLEKESV